MSLDLKRDILEAAIYEKLMADKTKPIMANNSCQCLKTAYKDEYWGYWLECECGYKSNVDYAKYCGGCGKELRIIGTTKDIEHYGQR